jgi:hypothetical protein
MLAEVVRNGAGSILLNAGAGPSDPASAGAVVAPDDELVLSNIRAIWVGTAGNLAVSLGGVTVILKNVANGTLIPIAPTSVLSTGTTAADIVSLR